MHFHCEVWLPELPEGKTLNELIESEMAPHMEVYNEDTEESTGWWDFWVIGGRWTGAKDGYDPADEDANYTPCDLCNGTGDRPGVGGPGYCNACHTGREKERPGFKLVWPTQFKSHAGDVAPISQLPDDFNCYRLVAGERMYVKEIFHYIPEGESYFEQSWDGDVKKVLGDAPGVLVTVDYHS